MVNDPFAAIIGRPRRDRRPRVASRTVSAGMIIVAGGRQHAGIRPVVPAPLDVAGSVVGTGLSHGDLPFAAGARPVSQPPAPVVNADDRTNIALLIELASFFVDRLWSTAFFRPFGGRCLNHLRIGRQRLMFVHRVSAERLGLARTARLTDDILPNLDLTGCAGAQSLFTHLEERLP